MVNPAPEPSKEAVLPKQATESVPQLPPRPPQKERIETGQNKEIEAHIGGLACPDDFDVNSSNELKSALDEFGTPSQIPEEIKIGSGRHSRKARDLTTIGTSETRFEDGYDTEDTTGPFWDAVEAEGPQMFDDIALQSDPLPGTKVTNLTFANAGVVSGTAASETTTEAPAASTTTNHDDIDSKDGKWLVKELTLRLLPIHGAKKVKAARLKQAINDGVRRYGTLEEAKEAKKNKPKKKKEINSMKAFPPTAKWKPLVPSSVRVPEPRNEHFIKKPRAPTVPANQKDPVKYNFNQKFERPSLKGTKKAIKTDRRNNPTGIETLPRLKGCVNLDWRKKHNLSSHSKPWEFAEAFIPYRDQKKTEDHLSFEKLTRWTNLKATLAGAGSTTYQDWKAFTPKELRQHFGMYILHGLNPSARVEYKFASQIADPISGNDFVFNAFGSNGARRHKHFKAFLGCCDPSIYPPSRRKFPNWKVRALFKWLNKISPEAWSCGPSIAVDEMTMRFKGAHKDKLRISFKREGDGFMADALCDDGFTYQIYMRNDPAPVRYTSKGLSPLLARTMALFDSLRDKNHRVGMDNLYNSAAFCRHAYNHRNQLLCHGVTRKYGRGIPKCVMQEEQKNKSDLERVRGTVKAAVLVGDPNCPDLIASSVYDTKPVHMLSMVAEGIEWVTKTRRVYNVETERVDEMEFLRLNQIDQYNHGMGDVDLADQLRGVYRLDTSIRNRKWWWSMLFWSFGVLLTNAYKVYLSVCDEEKVAKKDRISHYEFRKGIALYWINEMEGSRFFNSTNANGMAERRRTEFMSPSSVSTMTARSPGSASCSVAGSHSSRRAHPVNDRTLSENGLYCCRLNTQLRHLPIPSKGRVKCGLHRWAEFRKEGNLLYCPDCNVNLCSDCYSDFHQVADLASPGRKQALKRKFKRNGDSIDTERSKNNRKRRRR